MKRTQIYLTDEIVSFIKTFGGSQHLSQSDIIRKAMELYMQSAKKPDRKQILKQSAGLWKDSTFDYQKQRKSWDR